jgi:hypothetical protein
MPYVLRGGKVVVLADEGQQALESEVEQLGRHVHEQNHVQALRRREWMESVKQ